MFETFRNAFKAEELRKKILYTLLIIVIFRLGAAIPVPFLDASVLNNIMEQYSGTFLEYLNIMTGGALSQATLFAMSITPYINASIIIQLLTVAIPALERMQKEGESGRKKLQKITRYTTLGLALVQALGYYLMLKNQLHAVSPSTGFEGVFAAVVIITTFTAGTALIVWLGERITEKGIGNGISIILFAGIISRGPDAIRALINWWQTGQYVMTILIPIIFLLMIALIVLMTNAERRIPVQYAKRVVGRRMYGGQSTHIPIKVSMSGVMPIIFASSLMSIPSMIATFVNVKEGGFWDSFLGLFQHDSWFYAIFYFVLIIGFNFFYVAIQYNPVEIANNLRKNNGAIPGIRSGNPTSTYISKVLSKITVVGAIFLGVIAVFPILFTVISGVNISLGGTSILIIVGVALDTMRSLESQMMMRHHKGFLE
ncbi:MAG TPA: preprotein translocase subunit SecY [Firmicutes bacterium]|nr:preprotein translocase subunit SecY [Bacillota bacterium]